MASNHQQYLLFICAIACFSLRYALAYRETCPRESDLFIYDQFRCPIWISPNPPLQVNGNSLDSVLSSQHRNDYTSVLFYASWCPFSRHMLLNYEKLSYMFPQVEHLAVEQSSALPSLFSRYGIRGLPSILMVNQTTKTRHTGSKDLQSFVQFYERTTGLKPIQHIMEDEPVSMKDNEKSTMGPWNGSSLDEMIKSEPYLILASMFLFLKALLYISPKVLSHIKVFYISHAPHLNLGKFGETSQLFNQILHMIDVRRIWNKLRLCKTRNFHQSAKNARVWATSLASVSLGESSSSRSSF